MTTVNIKFNNKNTATAATYNTTGTFDPVGTGTVIASLLDDTGASTGLSMSVVTSCHGTGGSGANADADIWGIPQSVWQDYWLFKSSTKNGSIKISGFAAGQSGTLTCCGHGNNIRDTNFIANGGTPVLYDGKVKPPNPPVTVPFTADGSGEVVVSTTYTDSFSYVNAINISYTVSVTPTITSITNFISGSTATLTLSSSSYAATTASISDGIISKTVTLTSAGGADYTFPVPSWADGETVIKYGTVNTTATDGSTTTNAYAATISPTANYDTVVALSVSASNYGQIYGFSPPLKIGTQNLFNTLHGKVNNDETWDDNGTGFTGTTQVWDRDPDDYIARVSNLIVNGGSIVNGGGLTSSGLTSVGLTRVGLTSAGL